MMPQLSSCQRPRRCDALIQRAKRASFAVLAAASLLACSALEVFATSGSAAGGTAGGVEIVSADARGVVIEMRTSALGEQQEVGPDGEGYTLLSLEGFEAAGAPGLPTLPQRTLLLAVPPSAKLHVEVQAESEQWQSLSAPIRPGPGVAAGAIAPDGSPVASAGTTETFVRDAVAYAAASAYPASAFSLVEEGFIRDVRVVSLTLSPLQYYASQQLVRQITHLRLGITFEYDAQPQVVTSDVGGFVKLTEALVANPAQVAAFRAQTERAVPAAAPGSLPLDRVRYRVNIDQTGIYRLTYGDLVAAGMPVAGLDPRRLQLYEGDQEVAIEVRGEADGTFDSADEIVFYGESVATFYTKTNTLWLVAGDTPGLRMGTRKVAPTAGSSLTEFRAVEHHELDRTYRSSMPMASDVDHWYWGQTYVLAYSAVYTLSVPFTVVHPAPSGIGSLQIELWGASYDPRVNPDHHTRLYLNGTLIGDVSWNGSVSKQATLNFDQALLHEGDNILTLYTPGDTGARDPANGAWEVTWLNWFRMEYARALTATNSTLAFNGLTGSQDYFVSGLTSSDAILYDVTAPLGPVRLTGAVVGAQGGGFGVRFHDMTPAGGAYHLTTNTARWSPTSISADQPSGLRTATSGADYLIISHADFVAGVAPLAEWRASQGLRVKVVDVQDVYDEFNGGLLSPHAIQDFVRYAYNYWPAPAPSFVLLVGDGTYDFLDHEGYGARTFVPPFLASVDPVVGETAADNRFVTVAGDDIMPDLHIGRFPVNNSAELAAMVSKTVSYEATPTAGDWRDRITFVADNPDTAGQFGALSDAAAAHVAPEYTQRKVYLGTAEYPLSNVSKAQQGVLSALNQGTLLFNYVGHSSIGNWAGEFLFGTNSIPSVNNGTRWPVTLAMTCLEGSFHYPRYTGLAESVVRLSGRGALASWSPTGLGVATGHDLLHRSFYEAVFEWDERILGEAITASKLYLFVNGRFTDGSPRFHDLMDTYVLLGDPGSVIGLREAQLSVEGDGPGGVLGPGDPVTYHLNYSNLGEVTVWGVTITTTLPSGLDGVAWQASDPGLTLVAPSPLTWSVESLAPGATGSVTITGHVAQDLTVGDLPFSAEMFISSRWSESDYSDNRAGPFVAAIAAADLTLQQTTEFLPPVRPGDRVTVTLDYGNSGLGAANGVVLDLTMPEALEELQIAQLGGPAVLRAGSTYTWDINLLPVGALGRIELSGRIPLGLTGLPTVWSVGSHISTAWLDATPGNNNGAVAQIEIGGDALFEPNDIASAARRVGVPAAGLQHSYGFPGDQDWTVFSAVAGVTYLIRTTNLQDGGDTTLFLRDANGTLLAKNNDESPGVPSSAIVWTATTSGDLLVMVTSLISPPGFRYQLEILIVQKWMHVPLALGPF